MRINKFLSEAGYCSRRQADSLVESGQVFINGQRAKLGDQVEETDQVKVNNQLIKQKTEASVYLAYHKPGGVICTTDVKSPNNIIDAVNYSKKIYPVGRLDVASTGLIFLTNDGDWANRLTHPKYEHAKEYEVTVDQSFSDQAIKKLRQGVELKEGLAKADFIARVTDNIFRITIHQGWNKQIRRMVEDGGYQVKALKRIRIGSVKLGDLKVRQWRPLTPEEVESFK
ncbi:MAG: pseudouridine synthase [Candidatus Komeilibacteria bacterium]|nr:pseudouridine synthase [Candidatus Komeilibacteria bacterium]